PESVTYGWLNRTMNNIGHRALSLGLKRGDTVAILVADKIFHVALVLGLTRLGIVTVSARGRRLPRELGVGALISDDLSPYENAGRLLAADMWWTMGDGRPIADRRVYDIDEDAICRISLTSGSTGEARGIAASHSKLMKKLACYEYLKGNRLPLTSRLFCDLGLSTQQNFQYVLYMLSRGGTIYLFGADAASMVQAFDLYKIEGMATSPQGLSEYTRFFELNPAFHGSFDWIVSSGSTIPGPLSKRVRTQMCANLFCSYGAVETGATAVGNATQLAELPGAVGFVAPNATIEIVDDAGNVLAPNREGNVRVRSPHAATEYVNNPQATAKVFRDGWFYPGDLGYLTEDQMLVIVGRQETVL